MWAPQYKTDITILEEVQQKAMIREACDIQGEVESTILVQS